jgi:uridine phosphorylase
MAERILDSDGREYHIGLKQGEVARRILLVGDPARAQRVADRFDFVRLSRQCREFVTHTGELGGREISVMGTGIGCGNMEIAVIELLGCVSDPVFIRVGSSGALQPEIRVGDLVVSTGSVRLESTSLGFVEEGYPAHAHHEATLALVSASAESGGTYHVGVTAAASGFYGLQGRVGNTIPPRFDDVPDRLAKQGVLNFEMETSTLFTLATLARVRAGAVCAVFADRTEGEFISDEVKHRAEDHAISVGLRAFDYVDAMDAGGRPFVVSPPPGS